MKTSVVLDKRKVTLAKKLGQIHTLRELLDKALDAYIALSRRKTMAEMLGKNFLEGDLMTISRTKPCASKISFTKDSFSVYLTDGRILIVPLAYFPRLLDASPKERQNYEFSGGGTGIHWEDLDEDISVEGLLMGVGDITKTLPSPQMKKTGT